MIVGYRVGIAPPMKGKDATKFQASISYHVGNGRLYSRQLIDVQVHWQTEFQAVWQHAQMLAHSADAEGCFVVIERCQVSMDPEGRKFAMEYVFMQGTEVKECPPNRN